MLGKHALSLSCVPIEAGMYKTEGLALGKDLLAAPLHAEGIMGLGAEDPEFFYGDQLL